MSLAAPSPAAPASRGGQVPRQLTRSPHQRGPAARVPSPRLRVVAPPPATRRRLPFAALCAGILVVSLLGLLLLNIALTRGAYDVQALQREATLLAEHEQALTERLAEQAAPARLSQRATDLGMVPSTNPAFIRLSDGAVLGVPQPAEASTAPTVDTLVTAVSPVTPDTDAATDG